MKLVAATLIMISCLLAAWGWNIPASIYSNIVLLGALLTGISGIIMYLIQKAGFVA